MMENYKELYLNKFGKRFSKKEKMAFYNAISEDFGKLGYTSDLQEERVKFSKARHIYIGSPKQAKTTFVIPYNTPAKIMWPNYRSFPQDGFHQMKKMFVPTYIPMFIAYGLLLVFTYLLPGMVSAKMMTYLYPVFFVLLGFMLIFVFRGFGNKKNRVNNTNAIVMALDIANALPANRRKEVMFIFSDGNKPAGGVANPAIMNYLTKANKSSLQLISLFCLGNGDTLQMMSDRSSKSIAKDLGKVYKGETTLKTKHIGEEGKNNTVIEGLPKAMMITSGNREGELLAVPNVSTSKDTTSDEGLLDGVCEMLVAYLQKKK